MFDLRALVGEPGEPVDRLADDTVETAVRTLRLREHVPDTAVTWNRNVEVLPRGAAAPGVEVFARGLDVPEMQTDLHFLAEDCLAGAQLARKGDGRVLNLVV